MVAGGGGGGDNGGGGGGGGGQSILPNGIVLSGKPARLPRVVCACLGTGRYRPLSKAALTSVKDHFGGDALVELHLLTDDLTDVEAVYNPRLTPYREWPLSGLGKFEDILNALEKEIEEADYFYFIDGDVRFQEDVLLADVSGDLVAVEHPMYPRNEWGKLTDRSKRSILAGIKRAAARLLPLFPCISSSILDFHPLLFFWFSLASSFKIPTPCLAARTLSSSYPSSSFFSSLQQTTLRVVRSRQDNYVRIPVRTETTVCSVHSKLARQVEKDSSKW